MSIATRKGDDGSTGLMYNRRVRKSDARVAAYGNVDELNAALGLARATASHPFLQEQLLEIQKSLVTLMGELATAEEDLQRYVADGFALVTGELTVKLDRLVEEIEAQCIQFRGWATPGSSVHAAALDMARTVCRRAERQIWELLELNELRNREIPVYLNRLSDVLWLLARWVETRPEGQTV